MATGFTIAYLAGFMSPIFLLLAALLVWVALTGSGRDR